MEGKRARRILLCACGGYIVYSLPRIVLQLVHHFADDVQVVLSRAAAKLVAPHAVNWQVKQSPLGEDSEVPTDLIKLLTIVRKSGYTGYLPIETLSPRGKPYDPFTVVPSFLKQLRDAIAQTA